MGGGVWEAGDGVDLLGSAGGACDGVGIGRAGGSGGAEAMAGTGRLGGVGATAATGRGRPGGGGGTGDARAGGLGTPLDEGSRFGMEGGFARPKGFATNKINHIYTLIVVQIQEEEHIPLSV